MINTARYGIKELDSSELSSLTNLNTNADLLDKAIGHWGTASWNGNILQVTSEAPSQELYTGLSISFMLTDTNPESATIKLDSLDEKSLLNSTGSPMSAGFLTAGQIYTVTYDGTAFRINNIEHATSADSATSATNADTVDGMHAADFATAAQGAKADAALPMSGYTAADILSKIKTVDGAGSGLDADTIDGLDSIAFATAAQGAKADAALPMSGYTAADILTKIKTVDGAGSGLDADTLDGLDSTAFSETVFETAGGTTTAITLTMATLTNGYSKTFIASANNSGAATTVNGLPLYKPNTTTAPNLIAGKAYTVWYNAAGSCFFVKASAEGTATAADVLAGKTFSNDNDAGIVGAIPNNGAVIITPSSSNQIIAAGYHNGTGYVKGDANLAAANILNGKSIFGVAGNAFSPTVTGLTDGYSIFYGIDNATLGETTTVAKMWELQVTRVSGIIRMNCKLNHNTNVAETNAWYLYLYKNGVSLGLLGSLSIFTNQNYATSCSMPFSVSPGDYVQLYAKSDIDNRAYICVTDIYLSCSTRILIP